MSACQSPVWEEKYFVDSPCPENRLPIIWHWTHQFWEQMVDDNTPQTFADMVEMNRRDIANGSLQYFFSGLDGTAKGVVWGVNAGDGIFIGHLVFAREGVSTAEKLEMAKMSVEQMFAAGARKIVWQMLASNRAFRIFLKKIGAEHEGYLKQGTRCKGELSDVILMASFPKGTK